MPIFGKLRVRPGNADYAPITVKHSAALIKEKHEIVKHEHNEKSAILKSQKIVLCDDNSSVPLIEVDLKLTQGKLEALLDTGASRSFITSEVFNKLKAQKRLKDVKLVKMRVMAVDGNLINIKKQATFYIKLGEYTWCHNFLVLNRANHNIILGYDFIKRARINIDWKAQKLVFGFNKQVLQIDKRIHVPREKARAATVSVGDQPTLLSAADNPTAEHQNWTLQ